jgi:cyclic pyranopterin phosphate synthase
VSLDSLNPATFNRLTGRNEFQKVSDNIQLLISSGFHVKVNTVVMAGYNDHEICDFISWTKATPVHIRFIEFMPFPGNHWKSANLVSYKEILDRIRLHFPSIEKLNDQIHDTAKKFRVNGHNGTFAVISTMSQPFCEGCNRLRLTADGKMRNCLFSKTETDLLTPLRNGEEIEDLIRGCLLKKHFMLGGNGQPEWEEQQTNSEERSMLAIGG